METLWQDVRYGLRMLRQSPAFAAIALLTLALGIGSNTALFSVVNGVLLNPLHYPEPDRLVALYTKTPQFGLGSISYLNLLDWKAENRSFTSIVGLRGDDFNLTGMGDPQRLHGHMISAGFFTTLGANPIVGREFSPDEDRAGAGPVVLLGEGLWKSKFGSAKDVIGRALTIDGSSYTVLGVVAEHVPGLTDSDIYVPLGQWNDPTFRDRRISMGTNAIARLRPGVSFEQAQADMQSIALQLAKAYPESNNATSIALVPLKKDVIGDVGPYLLVLLGSVGFVLLIACANVANLLLARSTARTREFAIRAAMGANQVRIVRQLLTESLLLAIAGGLLGLAIAKWATQAVLGALPAALPRADEIALDSRVLLFTLVTSILAGVIFGLAPALRTARPDIHGTLKEGGRGVSGSRHSVQTFFVVSETALALILLVGAGLMMRSLLVLWRTDVGLDPKNVLTFSVAFLPQKEVNPAAIRVTHLSLVERFAAVPGVESVSELAGSLPMRGDSELPFWVEGQPKPPTEADMNWALFYGITPDYFKTMGIPLLRGRQLTRGDNESAPGVVIIDEYLAQRYFPGQDPIGKRLNFGLFNMTAEIVGVARHINHWGPGSKRGGQIQAEVYLPWVQFPDQVMPLLSRGVDFVARTAQSPESMADAIRSAASQFDPNMVSFNFMPMKRIISDSIAAQRFTMVLLGVFAGLALLLASIGIYGVLSYVVGQRTQEVGIRMALGAQRRDVLRMILGEGTRLTSIGIGIGLIASLVLTRLMSSMLFGVSATDPLTFLLVAVALTAVACTACAIPALRATRVDPMVALRYE
jgi:putative ABC transport system permease protein